MGTLGPPILDWTTNAPARRLLSGITQATVFGLRQYFARGGLRGAPARGLGPEWPWDCLATTEREYAVTDSKRLLVLVAGSVKQAKAAAIRKLHVTAATGAQSMLADSARAHVRALRSMGAHGNAIMTLQAMSPGSNCALAVVGVVQGTASVARGRFLCMLTAIRSGPVVCHQQTPIVFILRARSNR